MGGESEDMMTAKELKDILKMVDDNRILTIERPDENRPDNRYLMPTGNYDVDYADEYFVIYTD
ncbi:hypothetical protein LCGC14_1567080 [marine sediment metagenome]|uniref:Uncharacterized protein n=1 Tax=marine sediment metagenome TaxID=412755 RepID=A0A0F9J710_9ZZZZ